VTRDVIREAKQKTGLRDEPRRGVAPATPWRRKAKTTLFAFLAIVVTGCPIDRI